MLQILLIVYILVNIPVVAALGLIKREKKSGKTAGENVGVRGVRPRDK